MEYPEDQSLDRLLNKLDLPQAPLGFEHRVMARLREEREQTGWMKLWHWWNGQTLAFHGGFTTACAAVIVLASLGIFWQWEEKKQKNENLFSALEAFEQYQQNQEKWPELELYTWQ